MLVDGATFVHAIPYRDGMKMSLDAETDGVSLDAKDAFLVIKRAGQDTLLVPYHVVRFLRVRP